MKISERTIRISGATFIAVLMVGGSYLISGPNIFSSRFANAASTEELLKAYAAKDTDADGLPDWQEALYGTDPNKAISNQFGISDGEAAKQGKLTPISPSSGSTSEESDSPNPVDLDRDVPGVSDPVHGSITEKLSQQFLQHVIQSNNGQPLDSDTEEKLVLDFTNFINQQTSQFLKSNYGFVNVHTNSSISILQYANSVEESIQDDESSYDANPYELMLKVIQSTNEKEQLEAKQNLLKDSKILAHIAIELKNIQVPPSQARSHVLLVQSFEMLSKASNVIANYQADPIATLSAIGSYNSAAASYATALNQIAIEILSNSEPKQDEPGYLLVSLARIANS